MENGAPKLIPNGTEIRVTDARVLRDLVFVNAENLGWTAATNLKNKFLNETVGVFPPPDGDQKGANAAWDAGRFLKQITLIQIVGADNQLKFVSQDIADEYLALVNAAAADGVLMPLKSGFRTYPKQAYLRDGWERRLPGFNLAAKPGFSNHQDGFAYDFAISGYEGNPRYDWLKRNGPRHGFVRTVNREPWHWEFRPEIAQTGAFKAPGVTK
ncbi:MAG TPA: M15 family metallopeptidase [Pyrinomonadaceae bacterium]|nr:M15 family metallopeptidase [Pyrinomonadaceae bacterium]